MWLLRVSLRWVNFPGVSERCALHSSAAASLCTESLHSKEQHPESLEALYGQPYLPMGGTARLQQRFLKAAECSSIEGETQRAVVQRSQNLTFRQRCLKPFCDSPRNHVSQAAQVLAKCHSRSQHIFRRTRHLLRFPLRIQPFQAPRPSNAPGTVERRRQF